MFNYFGMIKEVSFLTSLNPFLRNLDKHFRMDSQYLLFVNSRKGKLLMDSLQISSTIIEGGDFLACF